MCFEATNVPDQWLAPTGLSMPSGFIASPLHRLVLRKPLLRGLNAHQVDVTAVVVELEERTLLDCSDGKSWACRGGYPSSNNHAGVTYNGHRNDGCTPAKTVTTRNHGICGNQQAPFSIRPQKPLPAMP